MLMLPYITHDYVIQHMLIYKIEHTLCYVIKQMICYVIKHKCCYITHDYVMLYNTCYVM